MKLPDKIVLLTGGSRGLVEQSRRALPRMAPGNSIPARNRPTSGTGEANIELNYRRESRMFALA